MGTKSLDQSAPQHLAITGASSGIGAALAQHYARAGASLLLFGRDAARLDAIVCACRQAGAMTEAVVADVADRAAMAAAITEHDARRPISHVFANAGLGGNRAMAGRAGETPETADALVATNFSGVLNTVQPLLPRFLERRRGQVILVGSLAGMTGLPQSPIYCATKAAVRVYGEALRRRLRGTGVAITIVSPGFVDTPMSRSLPLSPPGVWTVDRAVARIARGVARNEAEIAFPSHLSGLLRFGAILPRAVTDGLVRLASGAARRS